MASKADKQVIVEDLTEKLQSASAVYIADYTGINVENVNELRGLFRKEDISYTVYKNTLIKRAMDKVGGFEELYPLLENQNAYIFVTEELGKPAKILKEYLRNHKQPQFKGALVEGAYYSGDNLDALASMKSKQEVIGDIIGLLLSPINNVVGALQAQGSNLVGAIKTIAEKEN